MAAFPTAGGKKKETALFNEHAGNWLACGELPVPKHTNMTNNALGDDQGPEDPARQPARSPLLLESIACVLMVPASGGTQCIRRYMPGV